MRRQKVFFGETVPTSAIEAKLAELGVRESDLVKVLVTGNAGVGKSFLGNMIAEERCFRSETQAQGCTVTVERLLFLPGPQDALCPMLLYNIPGLLESDPKLVERNKVCISKAFRELGQCKAAVCFVLSGGDGGRLKSQDIAALKAIREFCGVAPERLHETFLFVQNMIPGMEEGASMVSHEVSLTELLGAAVGATALSVIGLPMIITNRSRPELARIADEQAAGCRLKLIGHLVEHLVRAKPLLRIPDGRQIELQEDKWKKEMERIERDHAKKVAELEERMRQDAAEHARAVERFSQRQAELEEQLRKAEQGGNGSQLWAAIVHGLAAGAAYQLQRRESEGVGYRRANVPG